MQTLTAPIVTNTFPFKSFNQQRVTTSVLNAAVVLTPAKVITMSQEKKPNKPLTQTQSNSETPLTTDIKIGDLLPQGLVIGVGPAPGRGYRSGRYFCIRDDQSQTLWLSEDELA